MGRQELTIKTTATTPGVNIPRDIHLTPYLKKRDHALDAGRASRNQGIVASEILLQSSEHPKLDFVGREAEDEVDSQLKHYIAVVNPESKAWELVEARKVTLRGSVRNLKSLGEDEEEGEDGEEDEAMVSDNFLNLLLLFFFFFFFGGKLLTMYNVYREPFVPNATNSPIHLARNNLAKQHSPWQRMHNSLTPQRESQMRQNQQFCRQCPPNQHQT